MSVVDGNLSVYGVENLRIADGSIMPRVTTGNTMAPCVVIGERAAEILKAKHKLQPLAESVRVSPPQAIQAFLDERTAR
jgi:choline dehydrogenase-like flavoprotein